MAFDAQKTILLEKQYLYVRASKGFELEGVSTERIWTNTGYYRFLVENVAFTLGNSYVTIHYDSTDVDFIAYCSDLFMEELQNSIVVAVENIQTYLEQFAETNHEDITNLGEGVSGAMEVLHLDLEGIGVHVESINKNLGFLKTSNFYFYTQTSLGLTSYSYLNNWFGYSSSQMTQFYEDFPVGSYKDVFVSNKNAGPQFFNEDYFCTVDESIFGFCPKMVCELHISSFPTGITPHFILVNLFTGDVISFNVVNASSGLRGVPVGFPYRVFRVA